MDQTLAILHHYGGGVVDFTIRKGILYWNDENHSEPTDEEKSTWWDDYQLSLSQTSINKEARNYLGENDWKITRHDRHKKLVELGKLTQPALSDQEYEDLLIECQRQADLVVE